MKKYKNLPKNKIEFLISLFLMIKEKRKWWLLPLLFLLAILSLFVSLSNQSILPTIYTLF